MHSPHLEQLLARLVTTHAESPIDDFRHLDHDDAAALGGLAAAHKVLLPAGRRLEEAGMLDRLSQATRFLLERKRIQLKAQHAYSDAVQEALTTAGLPFRVLKGDRIERHYEYVLPRQTTDVDLAVPDHGTLWPTLAVMRTLGFRTREMTLRIGDADPTDPSVIVTMETPDAGPDGESISADVAAGPLPLGWCSVLPQGELPDGDGPDFQLAIFGTEMLERTRPLVRDVLDLKSLCRTLEIEQIAPLMQLARRQAYLREYRRVVHAAKGYLPHDSSVTSRSGREIPCRHRRSPTDAVPRSLQRGALHVLPHARRSSGSIRTALSRAALAVEGDWMLSLPDHGLASRFRAWRAGRADPERWLSRGRSVPFWPVDDEPAESFAVVALDDKLVCHTPIGSFLAAPFGVVDFSVQES